MAATVVPPPLNGDGNTIDTEACTVTFIEEPPAGRANAANAIDVGILHVKYRILCRILNTMKNTVSALVSALVCVCVVVARWSCVWLVCHLWFSCVFCLAAFGCNAVTFVKKSPQL